MRRKSKTFWKRFAAGMTLIEVLAGAVLLGVLLTFVIMAIARFTVQGRRTELRIEACKVADELLENWWSGAGQFPRGAAGDVPNHPGWRWRTVDLDEEAFRNLGTKAVSVEILAPGQPDNAPSVRVEMLYPEEDRVDTAGLHAD